jgi:uncharacterized SAM-binding protein YcdF (DUF218 family)
VRISHRARRRLLLLALGAFVAAGVFAGQVIDHSDPLQPADAIFVLGGSRIARAFEARELLSAGLASHIVISAGGREAAEFELEAKGVHVASEGETARDILVSRLGVAESAVELLPGTPDNTAQEARMLAPLAAAAHWTRVIVLTDCSSTRRAGFVFRRTLGPGITVITRCARTDSYDPWLWWRTRAGFRQTFYELPKLLAYWCGLRG